MDHTLIFVAILPKAITVIFSLDELIKTALPFSPLISASIAAVAVLLSLSALITSISSRRVAGKAYILAKKKEERQARSWDLDVIAARQRIAEPGDRIIEVDILVTNRSEIATSIKTASLWLNYSKGGNQLRTEVSPAGSGAPTPVFGTPTRLDARSTIGGWLRFELPASRLAGSTVQSYDLVLIDTDSLSVRKDGIHLKRHLR